jgi:hypothetical protein
MEVMAAQMKKFDLKGANKITGNIKVYNNVIANLEILLKILLCKI